MTQSVEFFSILFYRRDRKNQESKNKISGRKPATEIEKRNTTQKKNQRIKTEKSGKKNQSDLRRTWNLLVFNNGFPLLQKINFRKILQLRRFSSKIYTGTENQF